MIINTSIIELKFCLKEMWFEVSTRGVSEETLQHNQEVSLPFMGLSPEIFPVVMRGSSTSQPRLRTSQKCLPIARTRACFAKILPQLQNDHVTILDSSTETFCLGFSTFSYKVEEKRLCETAMWGKLYNYISKTAFLHFAFNYRFNVWVWLFFPFLLLIHFRNLSLQCFQFLSLSLPYHLPLQSSTLYVNQSKYSWNSKL